CCLPVDQILLAVEIPDGINVRNEFATTWERAGRLELKVLLGLRDPHAVILGEHVKQVNALVQKLVPRGRFTKINRRIAVGLPFLEQHGGAILSAEVSCQSGLKASPKDH